MKNEINNINECIFSAKPIWWYKWVSSLELVDMHLWIFWTLPWDENDKWKDKYKTEEELAELYKKTDREIIIKNFSWDDMKFWHLYYQANTILWTH